MAENRSVNVVNGKLSITQKGIPAAFIDRHQSALASQVHSHFTQPAVDYGALAASLAGAEPQSFCDLVDNQAVNRLAEMGKIQLPARDMGYDNLGAPATDLAEQIVPMAIAPELSC